MWLNENVKPKILQSASILFTLFLVVSSLSATVLAAPLREARPPRPERLGYVADEILVKFHGEQEFRVVKLPRLQSVEEAVREFTRRADVEYAEPNYIAYAFMVPNDSYFYRQWGVDNPRDTDIDAPEAWSVTTGSPTVKIAILDTGIDQDHEDLSEKIVANANFSNSTTFDDRYGHGTHVAGIASASTNNALGVAGVGYGSSLMNVKVLNDSGSGNYSWVAKGIKWAADNGAKVINLSLGGGQSSKTLEDAVNYAWSKGAVLTCAAGNSNDSSPTYPGFYEKCIAVAATDDNDLKADFSSYGDWVDVAAPGVDIFSTFPNESYYIGKEPNYDYGSGTSMAAPHVAGLAGLLWATTEYGTNNQTVRERIEQTADPVTGTGNYWIWGRVNAANAVAAVTPPPPPPPPPAEKKMHIGDITLTAETRGRFFNSCRVTAEVAILDESGVGVSSASVAGSWSGAYSRNVSGSTGNGGTVSFQTGWVRGCGTFTFTVNDVSKTDWLYDPVSNLETSDSITP